ncbi:hypothetical protein F53441_11749 [Fusarium austroafricanum]|uniref:UBA domain-containing protein n=1 Tax=Fusarium austroafricanum TaxID=2364996 RepID=A0A8H4K476_9HYPO|nr:hypothetical protein F53441_11749 [Fusarium austroafricanum]
MPSTIPYNPKLALGDVIGNRALAILGEMKEAQSRGDSAQGELKSLLASKRSLEQTRNELINLGVDTQPINQALNEVNANIANIAADYIVERAKSETNIQTLRKELGTIESQAESPVDYARSGIKTLPFATDSMRMDVQFFKFDPNEQASDELAKDIAAFVSESVRDLGPDVQSQVSETTRNQAALQSTRHSITGTLVITASCAHRNTSVLAPCVINVDKGVRAWNRIFPNDKISFARAGDAETVAHADETEDKNKFSILSGVTYGSCFVGMVHMLNIDETSAEDLSSMTADLKMRIDTGALLDGDEVKNLFGTQDVRSHVTLISMGVIPSIVAKNVTKGIKQFSEFDLKTTLTVLGDIDKTQNKVLDMNSLMIALDDYLSKVPDATSGVPLNFHMKDINKGILAEMWLAKYFPGRRNVGETADEGLH